MPETRDYIGQSMALMCFADCQEEKAINSSFQL